MNLKHWFSVALVLPTTLSIPGCFRGLNDLGDGLSCLLDFPQYAPVESDQKIVRAAVDCTDGSDCVDGRTLHLDAELDFVIQVGPETSEGKISVRSEPEGFLDIDGFSSEPERCDDGREISGTVTFGEVGEGALVILSDGEELDRFSVDVQRPEELEVQILGNTSWSQLDTTEELRVSAPDIVLRAIVRGASGDRLVGGPAVAWSSDDASVLGFEDDSEQMVASVVVLYAGDSGQTRVEAVVGDLQQELSVRVGSATGMGGSAP